MTWLTAYVSGFVFRFTSRLAAWNRSLEVNCTPVLARPDLQGDIAVLYMTPESGLRSARAVPTLSVVHMTNYEKLVKSDNANGIYDIDYSKGKILCGLLSRPHSC